MKSAMVGPGRDTLHALGRLCLALLVVALGATQPRAQAPTERRVALVVGVSLYDHAPALPNALNDARDLEAALGRLGFAVETALNPDRAALEAAIRRFGGRSRGADAALFFYAGHAVEVAGRNWLLPGPARLTSERDLRFEAVELDAILEQMEGAARVSLVFIDACRENPFRQRLGGGTRTIGAAGLAPARAPVGTLVALATAPGSLAEDGDGRNSPFTGALLRHIATPDIEVRQMLSEVRRDVRQATRGAQVPWEHASLEGAFFFRRAQPAPANVPARQASAASGPDAAEMLFWESVRQSRDPAELRAYIARYAQGHFADLARARLAQLTGPQPREAVTPPAPSPPVTAQHTPPPQAAPPPRVAAAPAEAPASAPAPRAAPEPRSADLAGRIMAANRWGPATLTEAGVRSYLSRPVPRALAVAPGRGSWSSWNEGDRDTTVLLTLERCTLLYGVPCLLLAADDEVMAETQPRPLPRLAFQGRFAPAQAPILVPGRRNALLGYAAAPDNKAIALHPWGRAFVATGAASRAAAEEAALRQCREDQERADRNGPCFLYVSGDQVVLPERRTTSGMRGLRPPPAPEALATRLREAHRVVTQEQALLYAREEAHKALALDSSGRNTWRRTGNATAADAEVATLEGCQLFHNSPCRLIAQDDTVRAEAGEARSMPRLAHRGAYDPARIPILGPAARARPDVTGYGAAAGGKAIALHPWGGIWVVTGAVGQRTAEEEALRACNADPWRNGRNGPCFLYAIANRVVLQDRLTAPGTAQPATTRPDASQPALRPPAPAQPAAVPAPQPDLPPEERLARAQRAVLERLGGGPRALADVQAYIFATRGHKAIARHAATGRAFIVGALPSAEAAENLALEGCQLRFAGPCALVAANLELRGGGSRDLPRLRHAGPFRAEMMPLREAVPEPLLASYAQAPAAKAIALGSEPGQVAIVRGAASARAAEARALAECNGAEPIFPCFLYATGDRVVLAERRTEPMSP